MNTKITLGLRLFLGAIFTIFGLNGFLHFIPMPPPSQEMQSFMGGLMGSGYFFPLLKGTEILCGLAFLSGLYVPVAAIVLAPITINILAVHIFLDTAGLPMGIILTLAHLGLGYQLRDVYKDVLKMKS